MMYACYALLLLIVMNGCGQPQCDGAYASYVAYRQRIVAAHACLRGSAHAIEIDNLACARYDRSISIIRTVDFVDEDAHFAVKDTLDALLYASTSSCTYGEPVSLDDLELDANFKSYAWCQRIEQVLCE